MGDQHLGVADEVHDCVRLAHVLFEAVHAGLGVAVLHRLVRPGEVEGADRNLVANTLADRLLEDRGEHETVADDRKLPSHGASSCMASVVKATALTAAVPASMPVIKSRLMPAALRGRAPLRCRR